MIIMIVMLPNLNLPSISSLFNWLYAHHVWLSIKISVLFMQEIKALLAPLFLEDVKKKEKR
jgi:hypothetical protein